MSNPIELFQAGQLTDAIGVATNSVRQRPADVAARSTLCELLCFAGELERADRQLDTVLQTDPQTMAGVSLLRHLIRSELSRREVFRQGRVPDFVTQPTAAQTRRLEALLCLRTGDAANASRLVAEAAELDSPLQGEVDGTAFTEFYDLDDILGPTLEVYTATGKYYWIGFEQIIRVEFNPVEHLTDMLWRSASIETTGDVSGRIHVPVIYEGSESADDQRIRIGRATEWVQTLPDGPTRGRGQREFLFNDDVLTIMQVRSFSVSH